MPESNVPPAQVAKQALRRLAMAKLEPTPENYARAYAIESGQETGGATDSGLPERAQPALQRLLQLGVSDLAERQELQREWRLGQYEEALKRAERILSSDGPAAQGEALAQTVDKLVRGLERGGRQWTVARKKDGLQRVLSTNRSDGGRLIRRLRQLVVSWDGDEAGETVDTLQARPEDEAGGTPSQFFSEEESQAAANEALPAAPLERLSLNLPADRWSDIGNSLHQTVHTALQPGGEPAAQVQRAQDLLSELAREHAQAQSGGASPERAAAIARLCEQARRMLEHRQHLAVQLGALCRELSASLVELSEDESWAQGQAQAMNNALDQGLSGLAVRAVSERLSKTRERQQALREERRAARDALKGLMQTLLTDLGALGEHTDRFHQHLGRYNEVIEKADSLESLTGAVREMLQESRTVQGLVQQTQLKLSTEHQRATALADRVSELEQELLRLSEEVQTDQLTQVANRRGLQATFATEQAKLEREDQPLAIALLDIDNFKKLNDSLGHAAGDEALKGLAARAQATVRPGDLVARFGGEEFVLLLPNTPLDEAQQVLGRLQRALSASLFMHEGKDVFVTFSAGATLYRKGEQLEDALQRADEALYEAKRTGKNRTCVA
ncbi:GGDEF domain-containing protein [Inhella gelatinilytica]|uniref:diguanylate cyclase n=1 Tax=Inhella gelatinilytica TaxID=2795030 RepID=A0A931J116_9BURK|nr:GGDEF domain-containing protein [Inhella gelatinilytica]MBH9553553.1 diguanylate cyclase [Inhella gelatinilytica]